MKIQDLSVRHRLILNNIIMVFVPVLLLIIIGSTVFYGLRATGNFREREIELLWPEAGNSVPVLMGLSHIFTNVDGGERESLGRHVASMEAAGIEVAVVRDGEVVYETVPQQARSLIAESYRLAPSTGNVLRWDEDGLVYRYVSQDGRSIGVALGGCALPYRLELLSATYGARLEPHRHRRLPARSGRHRLHWFPARAPHDARHRGTA